MKVAIPHFREEIAPCFEYSTSITIFTVEKRLIVDQISFALESWRLFDRVRLLKDQEVDVLICGGIQDRFEDLVQANGIRTISWVSGNVENLIERFLKDRLTPGTGRLCNK
ncbi:MAG: hypothetical protein GY847_08105 [Proteobacteria bacterium]|nr:hypothetical protein [Pseudomonadota bacterium]